MYLGVGNGNLLQYSCLENPMDRGAWWATVQRVTQSRTRLKQLSTRWCLYFHLFAFNLYISLREGNGNPLQYSCLENPMDREAWYTTVHGIAKSRTRLSDFTFTFHFSLSCIGEGNGNPLQYSCLGNPMDRGAWWATVHRVTKSWTRLKQLSTRWCIYLHLFAFNLYVSLYLKWISWASLVVQWWWGEVHLPVQETKVFVPGLGGFCMPWSSWACAPQLLRLCFRAPEPQLLSPQLLKPARSGASGPQWDRTPQWEACTPQLEGGPALYNWRKDWAVARTWYSQK